MKVLVANVVRFLTPKTEVTTNEWMAAVAILIVLYLAVMKPLH